MVFLSVNKSPQVSRTLLSILAVLKMLSLRWSPFVRQLPSSPVSLIILLLLYQSTNDNWYNCHLHVPWFFQFPSKVDVLILLFPFFQFYSVVSQDSKVDNFANSLFFFLIIIRSGILSKIIIIIIIPCKFFTPALTDELSLDSLWEQVSSSHQDSSQYSSQS